MRLLLDTHVFLWWRVGDRRLKKPVRIAIASADVVFVSMLVAQAVAEQLTLVSADKALAPYAAPMLWA